MNTSDSKPAKISGHRSICPITCTLDIVGDKWTLLVVRDLFMGKTRYSEFQKTLEKIPTNILADRLKRLEQYRIIKREKYQERPVRYAYTLTEKGKGLWPLMKEIMQWGNKYIPGTFDTTEVQKRIEVD